MTLGLDHVTTLTIRLDQQYVVGRTPHGVRRVSPILSGTFDGPRLRGEVLPGGTDWNLALPDGSIEFDARYTLRTHDGVTIAVFNQGIERSIMAKLFAGQHPDMSRPMYGRTIPRFEVADGPYGWLNRSLFAAELALGGPNTAILHVYEIT
jgi:Protein of unknown function (DUF3237)